MTKQNLLVITDSMELGCAIQRSLTVHLPGTVAVFSFTYRESEALLTSGCVQETSLFVLELFRSYGGGLRAEGIVLADRWRRRKPSLVVSPLHLAGVLSCDGYWDTAAEESLEGRAERLLRFPQRCFEGYDRLLRYFNPMLAIPQQHTDPLPLACEHRGGLDLTPPNLEMQSPGRGKAKADLYGCKALDYNQLPKQTLV